jgi:hypothetical protein
MTIRTGEALLCRRSCEVLLGDEVLHTRAPGTVRFRSQPGDAVARSRMAIRGGRVTGRQMVGRSWREADWIDNDCWHPCLYHEEGSVPGNSDPWELSAGRACGSKLRVTKPWKSLYSSYSGARTSQASRKLGKRATSCMPLFHMFHVGWSIRRWLWSQSSSEHRFKYSRKISSTRWRSSLG